MRGGIVWDGKGMARDGQKPKSLPKWHAADLHVGALWPPAYTKPANPVFGGWKTKAEKEASIKAEVCVLSLGYRYI